MNLLKERKTLPQIPTHLQAHFIFSQRRSKLKKIKRAYKPPHSDSAEIHANLTRHTFEREEARTDNSTYKKLAVQWLKEVSCFVSSSVVADSLVLRNRQLLVAAKR